jgi:hypothetical protein
VLGAGLGLPVQNIVCEPDAAAGELCDGDRESPCANELVNALGRHAQEFSDFLRADEAQGVITAHHSLIVPPD